MYKMIPKSSKMKYVSIYIILSILLLYGSDFYAQSDRGQVTNWYLESTPYGTGRTETREMGIRWDVKYIDATGGHIQAKFYRKPRTECFAMGDFKWTFSKDVTNVAQDERIKISFSVSAQRGFDCTIPIDPIIETLVLSEPFEEKIAGTISDEGRDLFLYGDNFRGGNGDRIKAPGNNDVLVIVNDRSPNGGDQDARDGGFGFYMEWKGLTFKVYYKYAAGSTDPVTEQDSPTSPDDEPIITDDGLIADLEGEWRSIFPARNWDKTGYYITQNGRDLTLTYSGDGTSATATISGNEVNLTGGDWGRGRGTISQGGRRIDFDNGSYWIKLTTPGTWRPSGNMDCEGNGIYMYAEDRTGQAGKTIELPVFICNVNDLANMDVSLRWQKNVAQLVNVKNGASTQNMYLQWNEVSKGYLKIAFASASGFRGSGSVAILVFKLVGSEGDETPVTGEVIAANSSDGSSIGIRTFTPGRITIVPSAVPGDCDGDEKLTERDALAALQIAVEKKPFDICYDVNNDGIVNSQDARIILRRIVGLVN